MPNLPGRSQDYVRVDPSPDIQPFETSYREDLSIAKETPKKHFKILEALAMLATWLCFVLAVITISSRFDIAWKLGLKHQIQVIGLMLSGMTLCTKFLTPRLFIVAESCFGASRLQNYDAFLQESIMVADTQLGWRTLLLTFTILPIALSVAYKNFIGGTAHHEITSTGGYYGMAAPAGLSSSIKFKFGPTYMANATLPFLQATGTTEFSALTMPQVYGFNVLLLSNTSSAYLDMPMPDYMRSLQTRPDNTSFYILTAQVHGTVTSYNASIETNRNDPGFWDQFYGPLDLTGQPTLIQDQTYLGNLQSNKSIALLNNDLPGNIDRSWSIISFIQRSTANYTADLEANAMLFNTHRRVCEGTWLLTFDSIKLTQGNCNMSSMPDTVFFITENQLGFHDYYPSNLIEYLAPLSTDPTEHKEVYVQGNLWHMSIFTTIVAGMYWSRFTALMGYDNPSVFGAALQRVQDEVHYPLQDKLISFRPALVPDWRLYFVLAVFPVLATLIFSASLILSFFSDIDGGNFGIIALLGGVQKETLKIFDGASYSGALQKPVFMQVKPLRAIMNAERREVPQNQYIFSVNRQ